MNGAYIHGGQLHFDKPSKLRLDEHFANPKVYDDLYGSMEKLVHKFHGGQQGRDFQSLIEAQQESFAELMRHMSEIIETLSDDEQLRHHLPLLETFPNLAQRQFHESASKLSATLADIPYTEIFNGPREFQAAMDIAPIALNNIRPPNVVQQIWDQLSASGKIPSQISSASDFLAQGVWAHIKDGEPTGEDKITGLYNLLNFIGFCQDEKLHKDDKFRSSMGDHVHATYAAYAHIFITEDVRMAKKLYAVYEHIGIGTLVCLCKEDVNGKFTLLIGDEMFQPM